MATKRGAAAAVPAPADVELVDGAFGPSKDPRTPDLIWVPLEGDGAPHPWPKNPRINSRTVGRVAKSLQRFGWVRPLVANTWQGIEGEIIIGHTARLAALELKLKVAPVRYRKLSPDEAHAAALADNRLNEFSEWDFERLGELALTLGAPLFDIGGWDTDAHNRLLSVEGGGFLDSALGGGTPPPNGPANDKASMANHATLQFVLPLAQKAIVLQALALVGPRLPASDALVKLCEEKIRARKK